MLYKRIIIFSLIFLFFSCTKEPDVCECLQHSIDANKALNNSENNYQKRLIVNKENEEILKDCIEYMRDISETDKSKLEEEAKKCSNYNEYIELFD